MADTFTTHYNIDQPQVGADAATWGGILNADWVLVDTGLFNITQGFMPLTGFLPTVTGGAMTPSATPATMTGPMRTQDVIPGDNTTRKLGSTSFVWSDVFVQNVDFYSCVATPALNCSLLSSSAGLVLKFPTAGQSFIVQNAAAAINFSVTDAGVLFSVTGGTFGGTLTAVDFLATSDERMKTNIEVVEDALSIVLKIRGVTFDWKNNGKASAGVIAQDVEAVFPCAVHTDAEDGFKGVNYNALIALLLGSIHTLAERVTALEGKGQP